MVSLEVSDGNCTEVAQEIIFVDVCTGIPELAGWSLHAFPNPASSHLWLEVEPKSPGKAMIRLVDVMGRVLYQEALRFQGKAYEGEFQTELSGGMYFVRVVKGNLSVSQRVLVE